MHSLLGTTVPKSQLKKVTKKYTNILGFFLFCDILMTSTADQRDLNFYARVSHTGCRSWFLKLQIVVDWRILTILTQVWISIDETKYVRIP